MLDFNAHATNPRGPEPNLLIHNIELGKEVWTGGIGGGGSGGEDLGVPVDDCLKDVCRLCPAY